MKANQKFVSAEEAVSPVIGVILMVAITVVLAAVVFVLVSDLGDTGDAAEQASVTVESNADDQITVLLVTEGDNAPYGEGEVVVSVDGTACTDDDGTGGVFDATPTPDETWGVGESLTYSIVDTAPVAPADDGTCVRGAISGTVDLQVVVTIAGTVVYNGAVAVTGA